MTVTRNRGVLLIGIIMVVLAAFGVELPLISLFELGGAFCFASRF